MTATDTRIHVEIIIGINKGQYFSSSSPYLKQVLTTLSKRYGGATVTQATGYWAQDGDQDLLDYSNLQEEQAIKIELCLTPDFNKPSQLDMGFIKQALAYIPPRFANWIHVETWETKARHFSLEGYQSDGN